MKKITDKLNILGYADFTCENPTVTDSLKDCSSHCETSCTSCVSGCLHSCTNNCHTSHKTA